MRDSLLDLDSKEFTAWREAYGYGNTVSLWKNRWWHGSIGAGIFLFLYGEI